MKTLEDKLFVKILCRLHPKFRVAYQNWILVEAEVIAKDLARFKCIKCVRKLHDVNFFLHFRYV